MKLGSQVAEFGNVVDRIKNKHKLLKESAVRLAAMRQLKEIQSQLTLIDFLDVLAVMDPENPLKNKVEEFEVMLSELRKGVEEFVVANQFDSVDAEIKTIEDTEDMTSQEDKEKSEDKKISLSGETTKTVQKENKSKNVDTDTSKKTSKKIDLDELKNINLSKKSGK